MAESWSAGLPGFLRALALPEADYYYRQAAAIDSQRQELEQLLASHRRLLEEQAREAQLRTLHDLATQNLASSTNVAMALGQIQAARLKEESDLQLRINAARAAAREKLHQIKAMIPGALARDILKDIKEVGQTAAAIAGVYTGGKGGELLRALGGAPAGDIIQPESEPTELETSDSWKKFLESLKTEEEAVGKEERAWRELLMQQLLQRYGYGSDISGGVQLPREERTPSLSPSVPYTLPGEDWLNDYLKP